MSDSFRCCGRRGAALTLALSIAACGGASDGSATTTDVTASDTATPGGGDTSSTGGDTASTGSDYFRSRLFRAQCEYNLRCHQIADVLMPLCLEYAERATLSSFVTYDEAAAIAAGRVGVDETKVEACIASLASAGCSSAEVGGAFRECNVVLVGKVAPGGACFGGRECANGYCERGENAMDGCAGVCKASLAAGEPCTDGIACAEGTSCRDICIGECKKICYAPAALGDPCGGQAYCGDGLMCHYDPASGPPDGTAKGTCIAQLAEGEPCTSDDGYGCPPNLICDRNLEVPTCTKRHGAGGPCGSHDFCADGLVCDGGTYDFSTGKAVIEGKCVTPIQAGGACTPPDPETKPTSACVNFTICDPVSKTCKLERALAGEECGTASTPSACVYSYVCDPTVHRCVYERGLGETCTPDGAACVYGAACSSGGTCERTCE